MQCLVIRCMPAELLMLLMLCGGNGPFKTDIFVQVVDLRL